MLEQVLFVITLFVTRLVLPVAGTLFLGRCLERALHRDPNEA